jgi:AFG3 family protein
MFSCYAGHKFEPYVNRIQFLLLPQISVYGMNERIGLVSFPPRQEAFDKPYSQETAHMIDQEVRIR